MRPPRRGQAAHERPSPVEDHRSEAHALLRTSRRSRACPQAVLRRVPAVSSGASSFGGRAFPQDPHGNGGANSYDNREGVDCASSRTEPRLLAGCQAGRRVVGAPDLRLAVGGVDAADIGPASVMLHLFAGGAGVEGVGDEVRAQRVAGGVADAPLDSLLDLVSIRRILCDEFGAAERPAVEVERSVAGAGRRRLRRRPDQRPLPRCARSCPSLAG